MAEPDDPKIELILSDGEAPKVETVGDMDCKFELATEEVMTDNEEEPEEPENVIPNDANEDSDKAGPDDPRSELIITGDKTPEVEAMEDKFCEVEPAAIEVVIKKGKEPEEPEEPEDPEDEVPNDAKEDKIAVETRDTAGLDN